MANIKYAIEGILFAAGEPVTAAKLAAVLDKDIDEIISAAEELRKEYDDDERGFNIIEINEGYQICSRPAYYTYIRTILGEQRNQPLSNAAMEALAIIAYKQPITRGQVERIRGVNSDGCINRLYERSLIEECGRLDAPGRPILYRTTDTFLRCFGLKSAKDLPYVNLDKYLGKEQGVQLEIDEESAETDGAETDETNGAESAVETDGIETDGTDADETESAAETGTDINGD